MEVKSTSKLAQMKEAKKNTERSKKENTRTLIQMTILKMLNLASTYCYRMCFDLNLSFGGQKTGRSMIKSALALAVGNGVTPANCEHARNLSY